MLLYFCCLKDPPVKEENQREIIQDSKISMSSIKNIQQPNPGSIIFSFLSFIHILALKGISISEDEHDKLNVTTGQQCWGSSSWFPVPSIRWFFLSLRQSPEFQRGVFFPIFKANPF